MKLSPVVLYIFFLFLLVFIFLTLAPSTFESLLVLVVLMIFLPFIIFATLAQKYPAGSDDSSDENVSIVTVLSLHFLVTILVIIITACIFFRINNPYIISIITLIPIVMYLILIPKKQQEKGIYVPPPNSVASVPLIIHLFLDNKANWISTNECQSIIQSLTNLGFNRGQIYRILEIPFVSIFSMFQEETSIVAVIYNDLNIWVDMILYYEDGSSTDVSNAPLVDSINYDYAGNIPNVSNKTSIETQPGTDKQIMPNASIEMIYQTLLNKQGEKPVRRISLDNFIGEFEESYRKTVEWNFKLKRT